MQAAERRAQRVGATAEIYARSGALVPYIEKTSLRPGGNAQTVRLLSGTDSE